MAAQQVAIEDDGIRNKVQKVDDIFGAPPRLQINSINLGVENYLHRNELIENVLTSVKHNKFTVLSSPPATGKTSLLKLIVHKRHINAKIIQCHRGIEPYNEFVKIGIDLKNKTINVPENEYILIIIDDAQYLYLNDLFWNDLLKLFPDWAHNYHNIRFIISATHTILHHCPIGLHDCPKLELEDFRISYEEGIELIHKTFYSDHFYFNQEIMNSILNQCGGVIGAVRLSVMKICDTFIKKYPNEEGEILRYLHSQEFVKDWDRLFAIERRHVLPEFQEFLTDCLVLPYIHENNYPHYEEHINKLIALQKSGLINSRNDCTNVGFTSILAMRFYFQHLFPNRASLGTPKSIEDLVRFAIGNMSATRLVTSVDLTNDFPNETVFQYEFMSALAKSLPRCYHICPISDFNSLDTENKTPHREIDFYINGTLSLGVKLLVQGRGKVVRDIE